jgi:thiol-disulfide isomerase/thioredoxin
LVKEADNFGGTPRGLHRFGTLWRKYANDENVHAVDTAMVDLRARVGEEIKLLNLLSKSVQEGSATEGTPELEALEQHTPLLRNSAVKVLECARDARTAAVTGMQKTSWREMLSEVTIVNAADWVEAKKQGKEQDVAAVDIFSSGGHKLRLVGLYFSAGWCGPCRRFTPALQKVYMISKADGEIASSDEEKQEKKVGWFGATTNSGGGVHVPFEVVFVSWDRDAAGKASYIEEQVRKWFE